MPIIQLTPQLHRAVKQMKEQNRCNIENAHPTKSLTSSLSGVEFNAVISAFQRSGKANTMKEPSSEW